VSRAAVGKNNEGTESVKTSETAQQTEGIESLDLNYIVLASYSG